jgi:hypothetical protein
VKPVTEAEQRLWEAFPLGEPVDLRECRHEGDCEERTIRAGVVAALLLGETALTPGHVTAMRLTGARITGTLELSYAQVNCPLILEHCSFEQTPVLAWSTTRMICFIGSTMPGLDASYARIGGDLNCTDGSFGLVKLIGTQVSGQINFSGAALTGTPEAFDAYEMTAQELVLVPREPMTGQVDLSYARLRRLIDSAETWPPKLVLEGLGYDTVYPSLPVDDRLAWLARTEGYSVQPYEQLAAMYRQLGYEAEVRQVLIGRQRRHRAVRPWYTRGWGYLQDVTVGYGYRPLRALIWLFAAVLMGTVLFSTGRTPPTTTAKPPDFHAFIYSVDLLIPVINLGQRTAFAPTGFEQWVAMGMVALGWIFTMTITSGISRVVLNRK